MIPLVKVGNRGLGERKGNDSKTPGIPPIVDISTALSILNADFDMDIQPFWEVYPKMRKTPLQGDSSRFGS